MATCTVTMDIGYGPDIPVASGYATIRRLVRGDNGDMMVEAVAEKVPLTNPHSTWTGEQGVAYRIVQHLPDGGGVKVDTVLPESSTANFSDLEPEVIVDPGNGSAVPLADDLIADKIENGTATPAALESWGDALYVAQADLDDDVAALLGTATDTRSALDARYSALVESGWRDITAVGGVLTNGWTASQVRVRRSGNVCALYVMGLNGSGASSNNAIAVPTGFRTSGFPEVLGLLSNGTTAPFTTSTVGLFGTNGHQFRADRTAISAGRGMLTYLTSDSVPGSWPGTSV